MGTSEAITTMLVASCTAALDSVGHLALVTAATDTGGTDTEGTDPEGMDTLDMDQYITVRIDLISWLKTQKQTNSSNHYSDSVAYFC